METIEAFETDVATMYREWTGRSLPTSDPSQPYAPLRPDQDPRVQVVDALRHLTGIVDARLQSCNHTPAWAPPIHLWEADASWRIEMDLPGVQRRQLRLSCAGPYLCVRGKRSRPTSPGEEARWSESPEGLFERRILVPSPFEPKSVTGQFKDGVLRVQIPKGSEMPTSQETEIDLS